MHQKEKDRSKNRMCKRAFYQACKYRALVAFPAPLEIHLSTSWQVRVGNYRKNNKETIVKQLIIIIYIFSFISDSESKIKIKLSLVIARRETDEETSDGEKMSCLQANWKPLSSVTFVFQSWSALLTMPGVCCFRFLLQKLRLFTRLFTNVYNKLQQVIARCSKKWWIFSMLCNMRSKLIPTDRIYIHKYRNLSVDTFFNPHMYLKSLIVRQNVLRSVNAFNRKYVT